MGDAVLGVLFQTEVHRPSLPPILEILCVLPQTKSQWACRTVFWTLLFIVEVEYGKTTVLTAPLEPRYWLLPSGNQATRPKVTTTGYWFAWTWGGPDIHATLESGYWCPISSGFLMFARIFSLKYFKSLIQKYMFCFTSCVGFKFFCPVSIRTCCILGRILCPFRYPVGTWSWPGIRQSYPLRYLAKSVWPAYCDLKALILIFTSRFDA